jgi:hypothetical protein
VLQGLKGAIAEAGGSEKVDYDKLISQLSSRIFLLHNVHEDRPTVFQTRWAMSYLRGPLTRPQVRQLMETRKGAIQVSAPAQPRPSAAATGLERTAPAPAATGPEGFSPTPPALAPEVTQVFLPVELSEQAAVRELAGAADAKSVQLVYEPAIVAGAEIRYIDRKRDVDQLAEKLLLASVRDDVRGVDWKDSETLSLRLRDLASGPERVGTDQGPFFAPVPEGANSARELKDIGQDLADWLYYNSKLPLTAHPELGIFQHPDESERDFKIRLQQAARERRDAEVDALEEKYASRLDRLQDNLSKKERTLAADEEEHSARSREELIGVGETVFGLLIGRRSSRAISRAATKRRMTRKAKLDIEEAKEEIADLQEEIAKLEGELKEAADEITQKWDNVLDDLTTEEIAPKRSDIDVRLVALAWLPSWLITYDEGGRPRTTAVPAYPQPEA